MFVVHISDIVIWRIVLKVLLL